MTLITHFAISSFLFLIATDSIFAQNLNFPGIAPSASSTGVLNNNTSINVLLATKIRLGHYDIKSTHYDPQLLEIYSQLLVNHQLSKNWLIGVGYGFQRNNPFNNNWRNEHRIVQQLMLAIPFYKSKLLNRLRFEERWFSYSESSNQFGTRVRWQVGYVKQLKENRLYWLINNEVYGIPSGNRHSFISENWLYTGIGFAVKYVGHFETGMGYNSVVRNSEKEWTSLLLLQVNWSFVIPSVHKKDMHPVMHGRQF